MTIHTTKETTIRIKKDELIFSVIVPTLNRAVKIKHCLRALAAQNHKSFEVIVIDDGSTDDTPAVLGKVKTKFPTMKLTTIRNDEQIGANPSRNRGLQVAKGRYLAFLDDDCTADSNWLTELERGFIDDSVAATTGLVVDQEPNNIYELVFRGTHRLAKAGPTRRLIAGNMAIRRDLLLWLKLDTDRTQIQQTEDGIPDTSISGRGDEEGLYLRLRAYGYKIVATPLALVIHDHPYTRSSFFRQAQMGGRSAAKLVYKYRLGPRIDMIFFILGYATLPFVLIWPWLFYISLGFLGLGVAAISYNDLFLKGKTWKQFILGFPILLAYYHVRLWGYITESLMLHLGHVSIERVNLAHEVRGWQDKK